MKSIIVLLLGAIASLSATTSAVDHRCITPESFPRKKLLLLGEIHGTVESPALVASLACALSKETSIAVGLEIPKSDQPLIDSYLSSRGGPKDKVLLLSSYFWGKGRDGRSSKAMFDLIETIRDLNRRGRGIAVFAFDWQPNSALERNVALADGIRSYVVAHPEKTIIVLTGNIHAMKQDRGSGKDLLIPSGKLLADLEPISVELATPSGNSWMCIPGCGIHNIPKGKTDSLPAGIGPGRFGGYDFTFRLPSTTASTPAVGGG